MDRALAAADSCLAAHDVVGKMGIRGRTQSRRQRDTQTRIAGILDFDGLQVTADPLAPDRNRKAMCVLACIAVADEKSAPATRRIRAAQLAINEEVETDSPVGMLSVDQPAPEERTSNLYDSAVLRGHQDLLFADIPFS
jgi:2-methylaconitate cis-trans-isomerase PrpF